MKIIIRTVLSLVAIVAALFVINALGKQGEPLPDGSESAARLADGPYRVAEIKRNFIDSSRATQANNDFKGATSRKLETRIWYPADSDTAAPLLVYSHGFTANNGDSVTLHKHLASHGYVVIAANFPLTNTFAPGGPMGPDVANQPDDVSFLIDRLLELNQDSKSALYNKIDPERIGAMGISMGGLTSTVLAFHPERHDARVDAAISIAGPFSIFQEAFFAARQLPFLMIAGDIDAIVPYPENALPVLDLVPDAALLTVASASHAGFADAALPLRWTNNPDAIGCYLVNRNLADEAEDDPRWQDLFGPSSLGIDYAARGPLCEMDPLPEALNVVRQTKLLRLAVRAFFDAEFASDPNARQRAAEYLQTTMASELSEVDYRRARG